MGLDWFTSFRDAELAHMARLAEGFDTPELRRKLEEKISVFSRSAIEAALRAPAAGTGAPLSVIQFWDSPHPPQDVLACLQSWEAAGAPLRRFDADQALAFLEQNFDPEVVACFRHCHHPAMQSDYFRLAILLQEGGLYIDADDRFLGAGPISDLSAGVTLMPLARIRGAGGMAGIREALAAHAEGASVYFYFNNAPISCPPGHPLIVLAFRRATQRVQEKMQQGQMADIHHDTGPINFSTALLEFALACHRDGTPLEIDIRIDWNWLSSFERLAYKKTDMNWRRNVPLSWKQ